MLRVSGLRVSRLRVTGFRIYGFGVFRGSVLCFGKRSLFWDVGFCRRLNNYHYQYYFGGFLVVTIV